MNWSVNTVVVRKGDALLFFIFVKIDKINFPVYHINIASKSFEKQEGMQFILFICPRSTMFIISYDLL